MPVNLYDFMEVPTKQEREKIYKEAHILKSLNLELDYKKIVHNENFIDAFDLYGEFNSWLRQFNNRLGELKLTYIMVAFYFSKGIPDEEWYLSPGRGGQSIEYYPHFEDKHFAIKYFFDYYSDIYYYKYFGIWDSIYHLINIYYKINIDNFSNRFKYNVMKELKKSDRVLYDYLINLKENDVYIKAQKLRNNLTHNFPSNDIDSGVTRLKGGITIEGLGNYVTTKEFKENIESGLVILADMLKFLKTRFEAVSIW